MPRTVRRAAADSSKRSSGSVDGAPRRPLSSRQLPLGSYMCASRQAGSVHGTLVRTQPKSRRGLRSCCRRPRRIQTPSRPKPGSIASLSGSFPGAFPRMCGDPEHGHNGVKLQCAGPTCPRPSSGNAFGRPRKPCRSAFWRYWRARVDRRAPAALRGVRVPDSPGKPLVGRARRFDRSGLCRHSLGQHVPQDQTATAGPAGQGFCSAASCRALR